VIINTHMHIDHAGGNAEMQEVSGAGIHMHRADYALAEREAHDLYRQVVRKVAPMLDNDPDVEGVLPGSVATIAAHRARAA
jgi:glyoxylase-like metal-dependent hydrolase (beta-lactamase superfamily II)